MQECEVGAMGLAGPGSKTLEGVAKEETREGPIVRKDSLKRASEKNPMADRYVSGSGKRHRAGRAIPNHRQQSDPS